MNHFPSPYRFPAPGRMKPTKSPTPQLVGPIRSSNGSAATEYIPYVKNRTSAVSLTHKLVQYTGQDKVTLEVEALP